MLGVIGLAFFLTLNRSEPVRKPDDMSLKNPLDLTEAATFAVVLTLALLASKGAATMFGDQALLAVSVITGAIDIEAVSLSVPKLAGTIVSARIAILAIVFAIISNTFFKGALFLVIARRRYFRSLSLLVFGTSVSGLLALAFVPA